MSIGGSGDSCRNLKRAAIESNAIGIGTQIVVGGNGNRAGIDGRGAGIGIGTGKGERAAALLRQRAGAGNHTTVSLKCAAGINQGGVVGDFSRVNAAAQNPGAIDRQGAGANRRRARVSVGAGEGERAAAQLCQCAAAGNHPAVGLIHAAGIDQRAAVRRGVCIVAAAQIAGPANRECAAATADGGGAGVSIGAGQHPLARANLGQREGAVGVIHNSLGQGVGAGVGAGQAERVGAAVGGIQDGGIQIGDAAGICRVQGKGLAACTHPRPNQRARGGAVVGSDIAQGRGGAGEGKRNGSAGAGRTFAQRTGRALIGYGGEFRVAVGYRNIARVIIRIVAEPNRAEGVTGTLFRHAARAGDIGRHRQVVRVGGIEVGRHAAVHGNGAARADGHNRAYGQYSIVRNRQGSARGERHAPAGRTQRSVIRKQNRAGAADGGAAGISVRAEESELTGAAFGHRAAPGNHAAQSLQRRAAVVEHAVVGDGGRIAAAPQLAGAANQQRAAAEGRRAGVSVHRVQPQYGVAGRAAGIVLIGKRDAKTAGHGRIGDVNQCHRVVEFAVENTVRRERHATRQGVSLIRGKNAHDAAVEGDGVGQCPGAAGGELRRAVHGNRAGAESFVVAHNGLGGIERGAAGKCVHTGDRKHDRAVLDQLAAASGIGQHAADGGNARAIHRQRLRLEIQAGASQSHRAAAVGKKGDIVIQIQVAGKSCRPRRARRVGDDHRAGISGAHIDRRRKTEAAVEIEIGAERVGGVAQTQIIAAVRQRVVRGQPQRAAVRKRVAGVSRGLFELHGGTLQNNQR